MEILQIQETDQDIEHFFERKLLTTSQKQVFKSISQSQSMIYVIQFLGQRSALRLQQLSRFYYKVQIPRTLFSVEIKLRKIRLHLFNHDYIILFNLQNWTKEKRMIKNDNLPHIWNCQSIEIRGVIYITGGSIANSKTYLKSTYRLDESSWQLQPLNEMNYARDAHGIISYKNQYLIVVGSWHVETSTKTVEMYDITQDQWVELPELNYSTCAPGLIIIKDRYLYKLGGTTNIRKIEFLDLMNPSEPWITINTSNQMGKKSSINRCLLHSINEDKFLVLGCHFGRTECPFTYHLEKNKFKKFQNNEIQIDMYRSNDVVQFDDSSIFIRPFVKVGEPPENVKVLQYYLKDIEVEEMEEDGPRHERSKLKKIGDFFKNVFSKSPKFSTKSFHKFDIGNIDEVEFATIAWEN